MKERQLINEIIVINVDVDLARSKWPSLSQCNGSIGFVVEKKKEREPGTCTSHRQLY